jgi:hypothetical protein
MLKPQPDPAKPETKAASRVGARVVPRNKLKILRFRHFAAGSVEPPRAGLARNGVARTLPGAGR